MKKPFTAVATSAAFAAVHYLSRGAFGVAQAFFLGLLLAAMYVWSAALWLPMTVHAAFDLTALFLIYTGAERNVATSLFN